jgi:predicted metal-dependent hydrolase
MPAITEEPRTFALPGGGLTVTLRRSARSRGLRVVIDPRRGVVVTVPPASRRGWARPEATVSAFLAEREGWIRRHVARLERDAAVVAARGGVADGATFRFLGELHRVRVVAAPASRRRSTVERVGGADGDELVLAVAARDRRSAPAVLEAWLRDRAREAIDRAIARHVDALEVAPTRITLRDPTTRWGSASRKRSLSFSWRLILAPPRALETVVVHELAHLRVFGHGPRFWALVASRAPDHAAWRRWLRTHSHELHAALDTGRGDRA